MPTWGIALISTTAIFFLPLIYIQNRELIDGQINNASTMINQQATQVRDLAAQHTGRAGEVAKSTVSQFSAQASDLIGQAKTKAGYSDTTTTTGPASTGTTATPATSSSIDTSALRADSASASPALKKEDFPVAPAAVPVAVPASGPAVPASTSAGPKDRAPEPLLPVQ